METQDDQEIMTDVWQISLLRGYADELSRRAEFITEPIRSITVEPQRLIEQAVSSFNRHRRGIAKLGGLCVGSLGIGIATGAGVFSHRHAH